jgi:hypothetical protein
MTLRPTKKPSRNVALMSAIFASGEEQRRIAQRARVPAEKLSHAIYGRRELDADEQKRVARVLKRSVADLFPATEAVA